jgi:hypothetical protein
MSSACRTAWRRRCRRLHDAGIGPGRAVRPESGAWARPHAPFRRMSRGTPGGENPIQREERLPDLAPSVGVTVVAMPVRRAAAQRVRRGEQRSATESRRSRGHEQQSALVRAVFFRPLPRTTSKHRLLWPAAVLRVQRWANIIPAAQTIDSPGAPLPPMSWPAEVGHPRLFFMPRSKVVGGRPSPAMTRARAVCAVVCHSFGRLA